MTAVRLVFVLLLLAAVPNVFAITDEEIYRNFQFSFVNPGARSTAMGGAFIGLADDATASEANPAGLTILTKPEVSFEYRNVRFNNDALNSFTPFTRGELELESFNDLKTISQPSFLSVVFPAGGATVAFSRQEVLNIEGEINETLSFNSPQFPPGTTLSVLSLAGSDQKIVNWNISSASKVTEHFSVGASLRYSRIDWQANVNNIGQINGVTVPNIGFQTTMDDNDSAFAYNVGALWSGSRFSAGAVYKRNPKFELTAVETGFGTKLGPFTNVLKVPDSFGFGVAAKPNDNLTISSDLVWIKYSDLTDGFQAGYNFLTDLLTNANIVYEVDDALEFHLGGEGVIFIKGHAVALRQGYYFKPSNSLTVKSLTGFDQATRDLVDRIFAPRDDEHHFTVGAGIVFGPHFQVDWAADIADTTDQYVVSTVVRF